VSTSIFEPLYRVDHAHVGDQDLHTFWSTPGARDLANFVWDTRVPQVTDPWPTLEPVTLRDAMVAVLGTEDVTGHLYSLAEFSAFLDANPQAVQDADVQPLSEPPCEHCGLWCDDKWCGLRGDEPTQVIEGVVTDGPLEVEE
jgi:hypothetical protein